MRIRPKLFTPLLAAGSVAVALAAAPTSAANPSQESCPPLSTGTTKCESPGNVEINDSLTRAYILPQWSSFGGQSGGPYGGAFGGGSR